MIPKKYLHDKIVLLLLSLNSFFAVIGTVLILLRISSGRGSSYIVEYRYNLGISAYKAGKITDILAFILFMFMVLGMNTLLSTKVYEKHRNFSLAMLGLGSMLLLVSIIVSNALLVLR